MDAGLLLRPLDKPFYLEHTLKPPFLLVKIVQYIQEYR
jgi:hypothetical protein